MAELLVSNKQKENYSAWCMKPINKQHETFLHSNNELIRGLSWDVYLDTE